STYKPGRVAARSGFFAVCGQNRARVRMITKTFMRLSRWPRSALGSAHKDNRGGVGDAYGIRCMPAGRGGGVGRLSRRLRNVAGAVAPANAVGQWLVHVVRRRAARL